MGDESSALPVTDGGQGRDICQGDQHQGTGGGCRQQADGAVDCASLTSLTHQRDARKQQRKEGYKHSANDTAGIDPAKRIQPPANSWLAALQVQGNEPFVQSTACGASFKSTGAGNTTQCLDIHCSSWHIKKILDALSFWLQASGVTFESSKGQVYACQPQSADRRDQILGTSQA